MSLVAFVVYTGLAGLGLAASLWAFWRMLVVAALSTPRRRTIKGKLSESFRVASQVARVTFAPSWLQLI
jgi:hypothetical protein